MLTTIYLIYLIIINLLAFMYYGIDKHRAVKGRWRIRELDLLLLSIFGGGTFGLVAMVAFRHKTKHWYFWVVNFVGMAISILIYWYFSTLKLNILGM